MAVVMGGVRRPSPLPMSRAGGHSAGQAGKKQSCCRCSAAQSRLAAYDVRRCEQQAGCVSAPWSAPAEYGAEPLGPQVC